MFYGLEITCDWNATTEHPDNSRDTFHSFQIVSAGCCEIKYTIKNFINFPKENNGVCNSCYAR